MCGWGVSFPRGGAMRSGVGWARGRLPAGSGCPGLTVGGSSAVSPWCVPWWSLVGWLKGVFGVYRIHGGIIVCWRAAVGGAVGCQGGACVGVVRVVGGGASCVVLGGSSWWSVVVVPGGVVLGLAVPGRVWDMRGRVGWGGGARVWACVFAFCSPRRLFLCLSLAPLFLLACFAFFWGGGWLGCGVFWCCAWVWVCAGAGAGVGVGVVGAGGRVAVALLVPCVCAGPQASGFQGAGPGGADGCGVGGRGSWVVPRWRSRARACVWVCSWRGLMGWWAVWAWLVCVGVGYVCAEGAVGWAGALWAMQWVEEMLVTPTGGVL